jgi:hypothetical protein
MPSDDAVSNVALISNLRPDTFLSHWRIIRDAKDEQSDKGTAVARAKKAAKRDNVDLDVVSMLEKLVKLEEDERHTLLRKLYIYSDWLSMPLAGAAEGMTPPPSPKQSTSEDFAEWQAGKQGKAAGKAGHPRESNQYVQGTPEFAAWDRHWRIAFNSSQKKLADEMAKNPPGRGRKEPEEPRVEH